MVADCKEWLRITSDCEEHSLQGFLKVGSYELCIDVSVYYCNCYLKKTLKSRLRLFMNVISLIRFKGVVDVNYIFNQFPKFF